MISFMVFHVLLILVLFLLKVDSWYIYFAARIVFFSRVLNAFRERERERERERGRERERERERIVQSERDIESERQRERDRDRERGRERERADLLLLSCPSHNVLPVAGAFLCPLCHCGQVVNRTGLV